MAENDVFSRNVGSGWKKASRLAMMPLLDDATINSALRALRDELKRNGCPGFGGLITIVVDTLQDGDSDEARLGAHRRLDRIVRENGSMNTEAAVWACKQFMAHFTAVSAASGSEGQVRDLVQEISAEILSRIANAHMFPRKIFVELRRDYEWNDICRRQERIQTAIRDSNETAGFASALLKNPSGSATRLPRVRRYKESLEKLLETALTPG